MVCAKHEKKSFQNFKDPSHQVTLSNRDSTKILCVFTDGSVLVWSHLIIRVPIEAHGISHHVQRYEHLVLPSARLMILN